MLLGKSQFTYAIIVRISRDICDSAEAVDFQHFEDEHVEKVEVCKRMIFRYVSFAGMFKPRTLQSNSVNARSRWMPKFETFRNAVVVGRAGG